MYLALSMAHNTAAIIFILTLQLVFATGSNVNDGFVLEDCQAECIRPEDKIIEPIGIHSIREGCSEITSLHPVDEISRVKLTPTVHDIFSSNLLCHEKRWLPGLNFTWSTQQEYGEYELQWSPLDHVRDSFSAKLTRGSRKCVKMNIDFLSKKCTLSCPKLFQNNIFVRMIARSKKIKKIYWISESLISFKELNRNRSYEGLPLFYRRKCYGLEGIRQFEVPNPRYWTPIVSIWNNSLEREVRMEFELATLDRPTFTSDHRVDYYKIVLSFRNISHEGTTVRTEKYRPGTEAEFGTVTFKNVSPGKYFISIKTISKNIRANECWTRVPVENGEKQRYTIAARDRAQCLQTSRQTSCLELITGIFHIHNVTEDMLIRDTIAKDADENMLAGETGGLAPLVLSLCAFFSLSLVLGALLFIVRFYRGKQWTDTERPSNGITILLIYFRDNDSYFRFVTSLKTLLEHFGFCCILLDDYRQDTLTYRTPSQWLKEQIQKANKIIYVRSEGAERDLAYFREENFVDLQEDTQLPDHHHLFRTCLSILYKDSHEKQCTLLYFTHRLIPSTEYIKVPEYLCNSGYFNVVQQLNDFISYLQSGVDATMSPSKASGLPFCVQRRSDDEYKNLRNCKQFLDLQKALDEVADMHATECEEEPLVYQPAIGAGGLSLIPPESTDDLSCLNFLMPAILTDMAENIEDDVDRYDSGMGSMPCQEIMEPSSV